MINYFKNWGNYFINVLGFGLIYLLALVLGGLILALIGGDVNKAIIAFFKSVSDQT